MFGRMARESFGPAHVRYRRPLGALRRRKTCPTARTECRGAPMPEQARGATGTAIKTRASVGSWLSFALLILVLIAALYPSLVLANTQVATSRLWPSKEYTRVTIEAAGPIRYTLFTVSDPHRVVL